MPGSHATLSIRELARDKDDPGAAFEVEPQQIPLGVEAPIDFPVHMTVWMKKAVGDVAGLLQRPDLVSEQ